MFLFAPNALPAAAPPDYAALIARRSSAGFREALNIADQRLRSNPRDATAAGIRALVFANGVDFLGMSNDEAREGKAASLELALRLGPTNSWTRAAFGVVHMTNDVPSAERELKECIAGDPEFLECYNVYGDVLRKSNRPAMAGAVYHEALRRWPRDGELIISNAFYLQQVGQIDAARRSLQDLVLTQPDYARGHWHLAVLLWQTGGDLSIALAEARRALALDPLIWRGAGFLKILGDKEPLPEGVEP